MPLEVDITYVASVVVTCIVPTEYSHTTLHIAHRTIEAEPEDRSIFKKTKNLLKDLDKKQQHGCISSTLSYSHHSDNPPCLNREDSYKLLWEELGKESVTSRESLYRTIQGIAVLRARLVLASILKGWPTMGPKLSTTALGCADIIHYFCLLDLLLQQQTKEEKKKVVLCTFCCFCCSLCFCCCCYSLCICVIVYVL